MYPLEDAGRINYIYRDNSPSPYNKLISSLDINKMLVLLISKGLETDKTEHFFQIEHSYSEDDILYEELKVQKAHNSLKIPAKNMFIPQNATVPKRDIKEGVYPKKGQIFYIDDISANLMVSETLWNYDPEKGKLGSHCISISDFY